MISRVQGITSRININLFGIHFWIRVEKDPLGERIFLQVKYKAPCNKTGKLTEWGGRKWYLSSHMTDDEIVKTAWVAYKSAIEHEVMETFKVDGKILFNPHTPYEILLEASQKEIKRS